MSNSIYQKSTIIVAILATLLAGCATVGTDFKTTGLNQLRLMQTTEADVISQFGKPLRQQTRSEAGREIRLLVYVYAEGTLSSGKSRRLAAEFVGGTLNAYLFHSALGDDRTDFDANARQGLVAGQSKRSDAINALGKPHGEVRFPSVLLKNEFGPLPEAMPPANAATALVYNYLETVRKESLITTQLKLVIVFLSEDASVLEVRHFEGAL